MKVLFRVLAILVGIALATLMFSANIAKADDETADVVESSAPTEVEEVVEETAAEPEVVEEAPAPVVTPQATQQVTTPAEVEQKRQEPAKAPEEKKSDKGKGESKKPKPTSSPAPATSAPVDPDPSQEPEVTEEPAEPTPTPTSTASASAPSQEPEPTEEPVDPDPTEDPEPTIPSLKEAVSVSLECEATITFLGHPGVSWVEVMVQNGTPDHVGLATEWPVVVITPIDASKEVSIQMFVADHHGNASAPDPVVWNPSSTCVEEPTPTPTPTDPVDPDPEDPELPDFSTALVQECVKGKNSFGHSLEGWMLDIQLLNEGGEVVEFNATVAPGEPWAVDLSEYDGVITYDAVYYDGSEGEIGTDNGKVKVCTADPDPTPTPDPDPSESPDPDPGPGVKPDPISGETVASSISCSPEGGVVTTTVTSWTQDWVEEDGEWVLGERVDGEPVEETRPATEEECPTSSPSPEPTDPSEEPSEEPSETPSEEPGNGDSGPKPGLPTAGPSDPDDSDDSSSDEDGKKDDPKKESSDSEKSDTGQLPSTGFAGDTPVNGGALLSLVFGSILLGMAFAMRRKVVMN